MSPGAQPEQPELNHPPDPLTQIGIDIACPGCEYNLRGLVGPIVECPECGLRSDVAELAARQWTKPWYRAPGFNTLMLPAACVWFAWFFAIPFTIAVADGDGLVTGAVSLAWFALWIGLRPGDVDYHDGICDRRACLGSACDRFVRHRRRIVVFGPMGVATRRACDRSGLYPPLFAA